MRGGGVDGLLPLGRGGYLRDGGLRDGGKYINSCLLNGCLVYDYSTYYFYPV